MNYKLYNVSVAIVVHNESAHIVDCLHSIAVAMKNYSGCSELIIVDNCSDEATRSELASFQESHPKIAMRTIFMERNNLPQARSEAIRSAAYSYVAMTDPDCRVPNDWLVKLVTAYDKHSQANTLIAAVGGGNTPPQKHGFYEALSLASKNFFGNLRSAQARPFAGEEFIYHLPTCNVMYSKEVVLSVGGFDQTFHPVCEDLELSCRLRSAGYFLLAIADCNVTHWHHPHFLSWFKKIYSYGTGQIKVMGKHPQYVSLRILLPLLFLMFWIIMLLISLKYTVVSLALYGVFIMALALFLTSGKTSFTQACSVAFILSINHWAYSLGMLRGLLWRR